MAGSESQSHFYFLTDYWRKNYEENADLGLAKSSIPHHYLNLTFPRKRTPRVSFSRGWFNLSLHVDGVRGREMPQAGSVLINYTDGALMEDMSRTPSTSLAPCSQLQSFQCGYRKGRVESEEDMPASVFKSTADGLCLLSREEEMISHVAKQFRSGT